MTIENNRTYRSWGAAAGFLSLALLLGGCGAQAASTDASGEETEASQEETTVIQAVPETIAQLGLDGQILPGLSDVVLPDAEPAP